MQKLNIPTLFRFMPRRGTDTRPTLVICDEVRDEKDWWVCYVDGQRTQVISSEFFKKDEFPLQDVELWVDEDYLRNHVPQVGDDSLISGLRA